MIRSHGTCHAEVGEKGTGSGQGEVRVARSKGKGGKPQVLCPEDVYSWWDRGEEVTY